MSKSIRDLKPAALWGYFADICAIPHPSYHEAAIRKYMVDFADQRGIECTEDSAHNVIMRVPATPGMENRKGIILQAHLDMVPQANSDKKFDFEKDAIQPYVDGDWVTADGTTLGADNGIGAAAAMAVLTDKSLKHGPVEVLFTATEEAGMEGAFGLKAGLLKGDILLNLDSETEGELYVGCAGGLDANIALAYEEIPANKDHKALRIEVKGLKGGHSGIEIVLERANANKVLNRFLYAAERELGLRLASIDGGGLRNAIPREAFATVTVPEANVAALKKALADYEKTIIEEYKGVEDAVSIKAADADMPETVMDHEAQSALLRAVYACPNGVMRMSKSMEGLVQTSTNLARVVSDKGIVKMQCLLR
ncbi:MAG: beta-Ala-His dipeptidase, partial [Rikenellaceae bacterium]|nr:beta-Ala-His dipeptidase [Rikenellaceae bacterium]